MSKNKKGRNFRLSRRIVIACTIAAFLVISLIFSKASMKPLPKPMKYFSGNVLDNGTFISNFYGYKFSYPAEKFQYATLTETGAKFSNNKIQLTLTHNIYKLSGWVGSLYYTLRDIKKGESKQEDDTTITKLDNIAKSGKMHYVYQSTPSKEAKNGKYILGIIWTELNGTQLLTLEANSLTDLKANEKIFYDITKSIQFFDNKPQVADEKTENGTYINNTFGFRFNYSEEVLPIYNPWSDLYGANRKIFAGENGFLPQMHVLLADHPEHNDSYMACLNTKMAQISTSSQGNTTVKIGQFSRNNTTGCAIKGEFPYVPDGESSYSYTAYFKNKQNTLIYVSLAAESKDQLAELRRAFDKIFNSFEFIK